LINRILIIGTGSIGLKHFNWSKEFSPKSEIKKVGFREESSVSQINCDSKIFLKDSLDFKPNLTVVANPAPWHVETAQRFAENNSHIFVEKPISVSSNKVAKLIATCSEKNLVLQVGYNLRFSKSLQKFKEIIDSQVLGELHEICCSAGQFLSDWRPDKDYRDSVSGQKSLGGGVLLELSHEIDYLRWIFGEVNCVSGSLSTTSDLEIDVEDTANFKLWFKERVSGKDLVADVTLDFTRIIPERSCKVVGEKGNIVWNGLIGEVVFNPKNDGRMHKFLYKDVGFEKTYVDEWENLLHCIRTGNKPLVTGEDGLRVVEIIEAIREANLTGDKIDVKYDKITGDA
jgi:predicted dehydrogenase